MKLIYRIFDFFAIIRFMQHGFFLLLLILFILVCSFSKSHISLLYEVKQYLCLMGYFLQKHKEPWVSATRYSNTASQALLTNNAAQGASFDSQERQERLVIIAPVSCTFCSFVNRPMPGSNRKETITPLSLPAQITEPPLPSHVRESIWNIMWQLVNRLLFHRIVMSVIRMNTSLIGTVC